MTFYPTFSLILLSLFSFSNVTLVWSCSVEHKETSSVPDNMGNLQNEEQDPIYLWNEGNIPATTVYAENNSGILTLPVFAPISCSFQPNKAWK